MSLGSKVRKSDEQCIHRYCILNLKQDFFGLYRIFQNLNEMRDRNSEILFTYKIIHFLKWHYSQWFFKLKQKTCCCRTGKTDVNYSRNLVTFKDYEFTISRLNRKLLGRVARNLRLNNIFNLPIFCYCTKKIKYNKQWKVYKSNTLLFWYSHFALFMSWNQPVRDNRICSTISWVWLVESTKCQLGDNYIWMETA